MVQKWGNIELEIILCLLGKENHVRGIAKWLKASHSTILRKLNKLLNEGVLSYKIEGKNKIFFIKKGLEAKTYAFNAERYKLAKLIRKYPELNVIIEDILKKANNMTILFGSYAKFTAKIDSDIDVYVETKSPGIKKDIERINSRIRLKIGPFDVKDPLIAEIIKNHVILRGVEEFYDKIGFFE